jgi:hypothetical protein
VALCRCFTVLWRHAQSRSPDRGLIWRCAAELLLVASLRWQERWLLWRFLRCSSLNKSPSFSLWRPCSLAPCCSACCSSMKSSAIPPRWWCGDEDQIGEASFNKQLSLLWSCGSEHQQPSPPGGHGGSKGGGSLFSRCSRREGLGEADSELIHADGSSAAAILCRQGGASSTSTKEALLRHRHGCSNPICREVIRSPRRSGGPWWLLVAGKRLPSSRSRILGGCAWRTPAKGGRGVLGLDCNKSLCSRVVFVKNVALSLDRRSPRANLEKAAFNSVPVTDLWKISGSF